MINDAFCLPLDDLWQVSAAACGYWFRAYSPDKIYHFPVFPLVYVSRSNYGVTSSTCFRALLSWSGCMPSSNGGDLMKAVFVVKHAWTGQRTRAVLAVVFDRVLGLFGLLLLAPVVSVIGWNFLRDMPARGMVVVLTLAVNFLGALLYLRLAGDRDACITTQR